MLTRVAWCRLGRFLLAWSGRRVGAGVVDCRSVPPVAGTLGRFSGSQCSTVDLIGRAPNVSVPTSVSVDGSARRRPRTSCRRHGDRSVTTTTSDPRTNEAHSSALDCRGGATGPSDSAIDALVTRLADVLDTRVRAAEVGAILSIDDLVEILRVPRSTLYAWLSRGEGPPSFRAGRHRRYRARDLAAWIDYQLATDQSALRREALERARRPRQR